MRLSITSLIITWTLGKRIMTEENDLFSILDIVQLENPPKNKNAKVKVMKEFEG